MAGNSHNIEVAKIFGGGDILPNRNFPHFLTNRETTFGTFPYDDHSFVAV